MKHFLLLIALFFLSFHGLAQDFLMQSGTVNTCTGTFYDTGGPAPGPPGRYSNNENFTGANAFTICPDSTDPDVRTFLTFTEFEVEAIFQDRGDVMKIYDGPDTSAPLIDVYTGNNSPGTVRASTDNASGCLTIEFISDGFIVKQGWAATITCEVPVVFSDDCLSFSAGDDQVIDCQTPCTTLTATLSNLPNTSTSTYVLGQPTCPIQPLNGVDGIPIISDDDWSQIINLPFTFEYYQNQYTRLIVSDNGQISFDLSRAGGYSDWQINPGETLPRNNGDGFILNTIYGAFHDLYTPAQSGRPLQINYYVTGTFPFRAFILNFDDVSQFSCNNLRTTQQIILYESSHVIDINIIDKPVCSGWNDGLAVIGIQGNNLTEFLVPPGRNTSVWTANDEQWRFVPAGPFDNNVTFVWTDQNGTVVGNDISINVCPPSGISTYTVTMEFTLPNGTRTSVSDDVDVERTGVSGIVLDLGPDISTCDATEDFIINAPVNSAVDYQWFLDGVAIAGATNSSYTVIGPNSGIYKVEIVDPTDPTCVSADEVEITYDAQPIANDTPNQNKCDDGSGNIIFDLTLNADATLGTQDPLSYNISYYTTPAGATSGIDPIRNPDVYPLLGNSQLIYVRIANLGDTCFDTTSFTISIGGVLIGTLTDVSYCDQNGTGFISIDFEDLKNDQALDGQDPALFRVSYHLSQFEADGDAGGLASPYDVAVPGDEIFVRVTTISDPDCYETGSFNVVIDALPSANPNQLPLVYCDIDNDGFGIFNLHDADADITSGDPNLTVFYFGTFRDATNNVNEILIPYPNDQPYTDRVFARIETATTDCFAIVELILEVRDRPVVADPEPLRLCDEDGNGVENFNLTLREDEILNNNNTGLFDFYYFEDQQDAIDAGDAALTTPDFSNAIGNTTSYPNTSNPQTLYVLVVGNSTYTDPNNGGSGCYEIVALQLFVDPLPVVIQPLPYELCDDEVDGSTATDQISTFDLTTRVDEITGGDTTLIVTWYETEADEQSDNQIIEPSAYKNREIPPAPLTPQTIIARVTNTFGCSDTVTLTLIVNPVPSPATPDPLKVCDIDNDGFALFNLTDRDIQIINGEPGVTVSYHETFSDAEAGIFPLADGYPNNFAFTQTIYVRVAYTLAPNDTGCTTIIELQLIAVPTPILPVSLPDIVLCDDDGDGFMIFNLTQNEDLIYGTQDPANFTLTYHTSLADAQTGDNPIPNETAFPNTVNPQDIFIRLESIDSECSKTGTFKIEAAIGAPIFDPTPLTLCDDLGEQNDGLTIFDLTVKDEEITGGVVGQGVSYFETEADALANIDRIDPDTDYPNTSNLQTIYVRVQDANTGCVSYTTLLLRVVPNPEPENPDPIILCDELTPNDGIEIFDLTIRELQILDGETWTVTYHESYDLAFDNLDAIPNKTAYPNTSSPQIIYVRVENTTSGCFEIVELQLIVNPLPDDSAIISDYIICEINTDNLANFDLNTKIPEILNGQDPTIFTVRFFESQADAENNTSFIINVDRHQNNGNPQIIWVGITNIETGCYIGGVQQFNIEVREGATANPVPEPYIICDNLGENDGLASFDLTDPALTAQILGSQTTPPYELTYYETMENAMAGNDPIIGNYENIINPQIIYARVTNNDTDCFDITEVILKVDLLPMVLLDETYRLCVDENGNPIAQDEGDDSPPVIDTGLDPTRYTFVWELNGTILPNETAASIIANAGGEYFVTITDIETGCSTTATTTVNVSSPPLVYSAEVTSDAFADSHIITVTTEGLGDWAYQLDNGPFQDSNIFVNVKPGTHIITIKDKNGCGSATIEVIVIDFPQFFTPNQDGYHDTWNIIGIASLDPAARIYIFDRAGKLLKQLSPLGRGWDGTYNGNPIPSSDYWFKIEYKEKDVEKEFRGHFTLKR